ncbi:hypothetical protein RUND412_010041 [Rhizina undulata]
MNLIFAALATAFLVFRAIYRKGLTPLGIAAAVLTAGVHALHPSNAPFASLIAMYFLATFATRVKKDMKERLTLSSVGDGKGGEGPRNHIQVFANSIVASILILIHSYQLGVFDAFPGSVLTTGKNYCFNNDLLLVGIIGNYATTLGDTLSSELGILATSPPILITTLRPTPPGTNGGVSAIGTLAGAAGAAVIGTLSIFLAPFCADWSLIEKGGFVLFITAVGTAGSLFDSLLGAVFQTSVMDVRTGKIVEAPNGAIVLVEPGEVHLSPVAAVKSKIATGAEGVTAKGQADSARRRRASGGQFEIEKMEKTEKSRVIISGNKWGVLSNNQVNLFAAAGSSAAAMAVAGAWWGLL